MTLFDAIRADAEKWREIAAKDGGGTDRKAEETLMLLSELDRLRLVEDALRNGPLIVCPRCEGQRFDVDACGLCGNVGWLNEDGDAL